MENAEENKKTETAVHCRKSVKLPECGIFVGSGIYPTDTDTLLSTMLGHYTWQCQHFDVLEQIEKILEDNQGNLAQVWGIARGFSPKLRADWFYALDEIGIDIPAPDWENYRNLLCDEYAEVFEANKDRFGAGLVRFIREAKKRDIYTCLIYTNAEPQWIQGMNEVGGDHYLGYDFGERYTFRLDTAEKMLAAGQEVRLGALADDLIARVRSHTDERHAAGWGLVMATSSNFSLDYEVLGGADVPLVEDFAFANLNVSTALSRGLYRQHDLPIWGSHLAHEHYSWLPNSEKYRWDELRAAFYLKYMAGSKMIINESGNWFVEHTLSPDSPKFLVPQTARKDVGIIGWGGAKQMIHDDPARMKKYLAEAKEYFPQLDYTSPICRKYREIISDFWNFVKANGTPEGQPETVLGLVKGNYDLSHGSSEPGAVVAGMFPIAEKNPSWYQCAPEQGWTVARDIFFPCEDVTGEYVNIQLSGTPYGQVDIVSFAKDAVNAEKLAKQYKALLFTGWNTCSAEQYKILTDYVKAGGVLFISVAQLSTDETRDLDYSVEKLVNGGDFSELCGFRVRKKGGRIYWVTAPLGQDKLGFRFPRRFGVLYNPLADIEITDKELELLAVDDEEERPVVTLHKLGKGKVYTLAAWTYPGTFATDNGPGSKPGTHGLLGMIYRHIANENRPSVYVTDDGNITGKACRRISFSYFPEAGKICLFNCDSDKSVSFVLHKFGVQEPVTLQPGEFRMIPSQQG